MEDIVVGVNTSSSTLPENLPTEYTVVRTCSSPENSHGLQLASATEIIWRSYSYKKSLGFLPGATPLSNQGSMNGASNFL